MVYMDVPGCDVILDDKNVVVNILDHVSDGEDLRATLAHVNSSDFIVNSATVIVDGIKNDVDIKIKPDYSGVFHFDVNCGTDKDGNPITDTITGKIDYTTGMLEVSSSRWCEDDNKVYSVMFEGSISTYMEFKASRQSCMNVIIGKNGNVVDVLRQIDAYATPETDSIYRYDFVICDVNTIIGGVSQWSNLNMILDYDGVFSFEVPCGLGSDNKQIVDVVSGNINCDTGILTVSSLRSKADDNKVHSIYIMAQVIENDGVEKDYSSMTHLYGAYVDVGTCGSGSVELLKHTDKPLPPDKTARLNPADFRICAYNFIGGKNSSMSMVMHTVPDQDGNFSVDLPCYTSDGSGTITDRVSGKVDYETGVLTASSTRYSEDSNKVLSIGAWGSVILETKENGTEENNTE